MGLGIWSGVLRYEEDEREMLVAVGGESELDRGKRGGPRLGM